MMTHQQKQTRIKIEILTLVINVLTIIVFTLFQTDAMAQQSSRKVRIANIEIDSACVEEYRAALAKHAKIAVQVEPGVLALQAVYDKEHPTKVIVFEVYASEQAYQLHIKTPHFLEYKNGTLKMVKSLVLVDVAPIALEIKPALLKYL
ncbi:MAG: antibiotic biosynthesis monooxygenase [Pedobacter sp.]|uniref:putative quinol monooxygenase n=1 Tax=Pedobacter sp. TaxID=1411316 RepID=UPI003393A34E